MIKMNCVVCGMLISNPKSDQRTCSKKKCKKTYREIYDISDKRRTYQKKYHENYNKAYYQRKKKEALKLQYNCKEPCCKKKAYAFIDGQRYCLEHWNERHWLNGKHSPKITKMLEQIKNAK